MKRYNLTSKRNPVMAALFLPKIIPRWRKRKCGFLTTLATMHNPHRHGKTYKWRQLLRFARPPPSLGWQLRVRNGSYCKRGRCENYSLRRYCSITVLKYRMTGWEGKTHINLILLPTVKIVGQYLNYCYIIKWEAKTINLMITCSLSIKKQIKGARNSHINTLHFT